MPESVPVIGDHFEQDLEALVRVRPTHILIQPPKEQVPAALRDLAEGHGWSLCTWSINTLEDIRTVLRELPDCLADGLDAEGRQDLADRAAAIDDSIGAIGHGDDADLWTGRVLLVYSVRPSISVFGEGTYLDGLLKRYSSSNAASAISGWGEVSLEDVTRLNPEAIILIRSDREGSTRRRDFGNPLNELAIDAVRENRVAVLAHPETLLPSTSIVTVAAELREILASFREPAP